MLGVTLPTPSVYTNGVDVALILNRRSRRGRAEAANVQQLLADRGVKIALDLDPRALGSLCNCGKAARDSGIKRVIIGGGDGTVSAVARYFAETDITVGLLPLGTGNALARDLALPSTLEACCDIAAGDNINQIDLGYANGDNFVNVVTIGVSTLIARHLSPEAKKKLGKLAYVAAVMKAYRQARPFAASLTLEDQVHEFETLQVVIGNGRYHAGPFALSQAASLRDGRLTVYALMSRERRALIEFARRLALNSHEEMPNLLLQEVACGTLETTPIRAVAMDGEGGLRTPIDFRSAPNALRVLVPPSGPAS